MHVTSRLIASVQKLFTLTALDTFVCFKHIHKKYALLTIAASEGKTAIGLCLHDKATNYYQNKLILSAIKILDIVNQASTKLSTQYKQGTTEKTDCQ